MATGEMARSASRELKSLERGSNFDAVLATDFAFATDQFEQVLLVAEFLAHCFDGVFGVILTEHRQMKLFEQFGQLFTQIPFHTVIAS